jgi:hypothetical protein
MDAATARAAAPVGTAELAALTGVSAGFVTALRATTSFGDFEAFAAFGLALAAADLSAAPLLAPLTGASFDFEEVALALDPLATFEVVADFFEASDFAAALDTLFAVFAADLESFIDLDVTGVFVGFTVAALLAPAEADFALTDPVLDATEDLDELLWAELALDARAAVDLPDEAAFLDEAVPVAFVFNVLSFFGAIWSLTSSHAYKLAADARLQPIRTRHRRPATIQPPSGQSTACRNRRTQPHGSLAGPQRSLQFYVWQCCPKSRPRAVRPDCAHMQSVPVFTRRSDPFLFTEVL